MQGICVRRLLLLNSTLDVRRSAFGVFFQSHLSKMSTESTIPTNGSTTDTATATELAAAKVPDAVDRAGDNTPTKPGTEASKASAGLADHTKHPPGERAESAAVAITGSNQEEAK